MHQSKDSTTLKMNKFPNLKKPSHLLATLFGVGKLPYGPGTWGSVATLIVWDFCNEYIQTSVEDSYSYYSSRITYLLFFN